MFLYCKYVVFVATTDKSSCANVGEPPPEMCPYATAN